MDEEDVLDFDVFASMLEEEDEIKTETEAMKESVAGPKLSAGRQEDLDRVAIEKQLQDMQAQMDALRNRLSEKAPAASPLAPVLEAKSRRDSIVKIVDVHVDLFNSKPTVEEKIKGQVIRRCKTVAATSTVIHTGDVDSSDEEERRDPTLQKYNEYGRFVKNRLSHVESRGDVGLPQKKTNWKGNVIAKVQTEIKEVPSQDYGGIKIMNPLISLDGFRERMNGRKLVHMSSIRMHMRGGDIDGDWVTIGVVVGKDAKKSKKGSTFSIWKVCDLRDCNKVVSLFLFGKSHEQHWKTGVGSAIGILNASFMASRESTSSKDSGNELCLTLDNPQKLMIMGQSKDFGFCRSKRKDGNSCTMFVNKSHCEVCHFHVQKEYQKTSSKRMDLQASFSCSEPLGLRSKILQKQQVMYGGQMFQAQKPEKNSTKKVVAGKDRLTLNSLRLEQKAADILKAERQPLKASHLPANEFKIVNDINDKSETFGKMLTVPCAGSRNLIKQLVTKKGGSGSVDPVIKNMSAKDLLRLQSLEDDATEKTQKLNGSCSGVATALPTLGKGFRPGEAIDLDSRPKPITTSQSILQAIRKMRAKGAIAKTNPNAVRKDRTSAEFKEKVKKRLTSEESPTSGDSSGKASVAEPKSKKPRTGPNGDQVEVNTASKEFQSLLKRKSKYDCILEQENDERQERYFNELEKKEQLETKMTSTMEVPCKAVSCKKCSYTALAAKNECRTEGHPLIVHQAIKRFFSCKDCSKRTISLSKLPTRPCAGCGARNYSRVAMWKERSGPKLDHERLSIRGHESQFVDGFSTKGMI